eukprot:TRINITY_DN3997_c0_g1_i3.p2 TRINITY_DN3997_c0_g1~~TRINITY_DN3997_c0_g1_i3.p2  ORF type:complete len:180 (+),score=35.21 TRINITY_DN3997_c0_g1_i3:108-647(+)
MGIINITMNSTKDTTFTLKVQCSSLPQFPANLSSSSFPQSSALLNGNLDSSAAYEEKVLHVLKLHSNPAQLSSLNKGLMEVLPKGPGGSVVNQQKYMNPQVPQMPSSAYQPRPYAAQQTMPVAQPMNQIPRPVQMVCQVGQPVNPMYPMVTYTARGPTVTNTYRAMYTCLLYTSPSPRD